MSNNDDDYYTQEFNTMEEVDEFISELRAEALKVFESGDPTDK